jgi:hypothetical protein
MVRVLHQADADSGTTVAVTDSHLPSPTLGLGTSPLTRGLEKWGK